MLRMAKKVVDKHLDRVISYIEDIRRVQRNEPESKTDQYMRGLANGIEICYSIANGTNEPEFISPDGTLNKVKSPYKMARSVVSGFLNIAVEPIDLSKLYTPEKYHQAAKEVSDKFRAKFGIEPNIEWLTSKDAGYDEPKTRGEPGYYDNGKVYVDFQRLKKKNQTPKDFCAHELGHFLDEHIGLGKYFSNTLDIKYPLKDPIHEVYAQMVNYVLVDDILSEENQPAQYQMYKETLEKLKITAKKIASVINHYINTDAVEVIKIKTKDIAVQDDLRDSYPNFYPFYSAGPGA